jgi:hypothetical protein
MSNVGKQLEEWLLKLKPQTFPGASKTNYVNQFESMAEYLKKHVHPEVEKGAAVNDADGQMFLNDHGPEHIATVIRRASEILNAAECVITPYEGYLFLMAAHLHDTGNLFGRDRHEQGCREIMKRLGTRAGDDDLEKRLITNIAAAHGGRTPAGGKDTVGALDRPTLTLNGVEVRQQFLAALLRFADEIADDRTRASRFALAAGAIPDNSKLYHQYSQSLHSVIVGEREVMLGFQIKEDVAKARFLKWDKGTRVNVETYLLDEIFNRTLKMHLERMYCMRFLRPHVRLDEIRVEIEVYDSEYLRQLDTISYRVVETGYPGGPDAGLHELCPELNGRSGAALAAKLTQAEEAHHAGNQ